MGPKLASFFDFFVARVLRAKPNSLHHNITKMKLQDRPGAHFFKYLYELSFFDFHFFRVISTSPGRCEFNCKRNELERLHILVWIVIVLYLLFLHFLVHLSRNTNPPNYGPKILTGSRQVQSQNFFENVSYRKNRLEREFACHFLTHRIPLILISEYIF